MIKLTESAIKAVDQYIQRSDTPVAGLRILITGGGCAGFQYGLRLENAVAADDAVVECESFKVLVDPMSCLLLRGVTIDFVDTLEGTGFKFNNPNASACCDCGQSFSA